MPAKQPKTEQMRAFAKDSHDGPIVMLNLLKFRETADYQPDDPEYGESISGEAAYDRYGRELMTFASDDMGVETLYAGDAERFMIGQGDWDRVLLVRYPSREHMLKMLSDPRYTKAHRHRDAGLLHQDLIETRPEG
ncbi:DUF1330 domain-containing protein [Ponticaulis profundi]|uniref:DUF1330 domain-containing protein n=1 Tax=Ponticaulis profundi TaxID=2665222 RepID=A0ABW1SAG1_9PROT